jgi:uncharacterized protein (TIGR01777 family)
MKVVVTGGTGFIGERLVKKLAERGDDVIVLSRRAGKSEHATHVVWTPPSAGAWLSEIKGADAVVHLAGAGILDKRWTEEHLRTCRDSRVIPTRLIAKTLQERAGASIFVSASAVGYYGYRRDDSPCEESASPGEDVIARLCAEWEAACAPAEAAAGVRVVRARIGIVLGLEGGALKQMLPLFRLGLGGPLGSGTQMLAWVHADDTVDALTFALDTPTLDGPMNVTAPEPVTMGAFAKELGRALSRPAFLRVPELAMRVAMGRSADVVLTGQNARPKKLLDAGFEFRHPELPAALRDVLSTD